MSQGLMLARAVPPGRILMRELKAHGLTQKDLAGIMGRPPQTISEIVCGKKRITSETAVQLAEALGGSPEFWLNLETNYRLILSERERNEKGITRRRVLHDLAPVPELIKKGWIENALSTDELEEEVCSFLGISSPEEKPTLGARFRYGKRSDPDRNRLICWVNRAKRLAEEQSLPSFHRDKLKNLIPKILTHARVLKDVGNVPGLLRNVGVHFLIVPHLSKTYLDGSTFPLDKNPVVALTLRHDRIDCFWFTLMHELAHVIAGHEGMYLDRDDERSNNAKERRANEMAMNWLIDENDYASFVARTRPYFHETNILGFAKEQGRHPSIILGRLQHDRHVSFAHFRKFLGKVSPHLTACIDTAN